MNAIPLDHPHVRASATCPLCGDRKDEHLLTCWPCYREHGLRYGNPVADAAIAAAEYRLEHASIP